MTGFGNVRIGQGRGECGGNPGKIELRFAGAVANGDVIPLTNLTGQRDAHHISEHGVSAGGFSIQGDQRSGRQVFYQRR